MRLQELRQERRTGTKSAYFRRAAGYGNAYTRPALHEAADLLDQRDARIDELETLLADRWQGWWYLLCGLAIADRCRNACRLASMSVNAQLAPSISDEELLRRAMTSARGPRGLPVERWVAVKYTFAVGSTFARQLCLRFDLNPDEKVSR